MERQARNMVTINSYADLFTTALVKALESDNLDAPMLKRLLSSIVSCLKHSSFMAVILTVELLQARTEAAIERSKILTEATKNKLRSFPIFSEFLFGGQVAALQKSNSESQQQSFIASSVAQSSQASSSRFKIPKRPNKSSDHRDSSSFRPPNRRDRGGPRRGPRRGGSGSRGRCQHIPSRGGASNVTRQWYASSTVPSSKGPSSRRTVGPLSKSLGRNNKWVLSVVRKGYKIPFVNKLFLSPTPIFLQQTESLDLVEEVNKLLLKRGSGEDRTGSSRLLFSYFPGSQEEREITTNNRSVQTEYVSGYSVVQNGDSHQGQIGDSTQRLVVLTRSDRCLSTCSYSPAVSEVSPFLSQGSGLSIQGSSIWPCDKSLCFHPFDGCHSNISPEKGNCTVSIFGRLVGQKSGSSRNSDRQYLY